jgi:MuDR family transposase
LGVFDAPRKRRQNLTAMASLGELSVPIDGAEYLDLDAMIRALDDWAVKQKFCFRTAKREASVAIFVCAEAEELGCPWRCRARETGEDLWVLSIVEAEHTCIGRGLRKYASASKKEWLDPVVSRHLNVTKQTTPAEIKDLLRVRFAEEISYKVAQLCRLRLLNGDIGI